MAGIADMLVQSALKTSTDAGDVVGAAESGARMGAQLAQQVETAKMNRAKLEEQKEQLQLQKVDKLTGLMEKGAGIKSKAARNAFFKNYVPKTAAALGLQDFIPEDTMMMIQADPEQAKKLTILRANIRDGKMTMNDAMSKLSPEEFALMDEAELAQIEAADKFRIDNQEKMGRAKTVATATTDRTREGRAATGETELAKQTAQEFSNYVNEGGRAVIQTNFKKLQDANKALTSGNVKTGEGLVKWVGGSDAATDILAPEVSAARDDIRASIVATLKPILGGAFAEKEGQRILDLSFNPRLKSAENAKRVASEISKIESLVKSKEDQFVKQGFLKDTERSSFGSKKKPLSFDEAKIKAFNALPAAEQEKALQGLATKFEVDVKEIKKALKGGN